MDSLSMNQEQCWHTAHLESVDVAGLFSIFTRRRELLKQHKHTDGRNVDVEADLRRFLDPK